MVENKKPLTPDQKFIAEMQVSIVDHEKRIRQLEQKIEQIEKDRTKEKEDAKRMRKLR